MWQGRQERMGGVETRSVGLSGHLRVPVPPSVAKFFLDLSASVSSAPPSHLFICTCAVRLELVTYVAEQCPEIESEIW